MFSTSDSRSSTPSARRPATRRTARPPRIGLATQVGGTWTTTTLPNSLDARRRRRRSTSATRSAHQLRHQRQDRLVHAQELGARGRDPAAPQLALERQRSPLGAGDAQDRVPGPRPERSDDPARSDVPYDTDSGELEQLTFHPQGRGGRDDVAGARVQQRVRVLHDGEVSPARSSSTGKIPGADRVLRWTIVKTINAPAALPFFFSPEVFTHNGRSYIFAEVSSTSKFFDRTMPNQLAISGVDPLRQDARLLTNDTGTPRLRLDPGVLHHRPGAVHLLHPARSPRPTPTRPSTTASGASTPGSARRGSHSQPAQGIQDQTWMLKKRSSASENAFQTGIIVPPILA